MELNILEIIKAVILGIVEGITEFLPISSTGHLIIVNQFVSFDKDFNILFDIVIQLGAIIAVVFYFIKKIWPFNKDKTKNREVLNIWYKIIVAILPAIFFGIFFANFIEEKLFNPWVVAFSLILGGLIIILIENNNKKKKIEIFSIEDLSYKKSFFIGLIQCLSMIPGVSRSASTIMGGMFLGSSRLVATEFSFFLAIPTMFAASFYSLLKYKGLLTLDRLFILAIGFFFSFLIALLVIKFLINFIKKNNFKLFGYYRILLGLLIVIYFMLLN